MTGQDSDVGHLMSEGLVCLITIEAAGERFDLFPVLVQISTGSDLYWFRPVLLQTLPRGRHAELQFMSQL